MGDQKRRTKQFLLMLAYFPFQLLWHICISPIIIVWISAIRTDEQAFEDTYSSNNGKHWWITRFLGIDKLMED